MKRSAAVLALLMVMSCALAAEAGAKKAPATGVEAAAVLPSVGVDLVSPSGKVDSPYMHFRADVTGADTAATCIANFLAQLGLPCNLVSYVTFSVDNQFLGQDNEPAYSLGLKYDGSGRHTATAQAWRYVWGDSAPVLLGQSSREFCLSNCGN
jgi:hypothetical protein